MGLQWPDVDIEVGRLSVRRALQWQRGTGIGFVEPKSPSSRRTVILSERVCEALRAQQE
jgi:integrase